MSMPITPNFSLGEFASHDGTPYPSDWIQDRLLPLCRVLEAIRAACGGKAITITSGYRSPAHNVAIGGATFSQHMLGRAADIKVNGMAPSDVHRVILDLFNAKKIEIGGSGVYPKWNHVDIRPRPPNGHLAQWIGSGVGSEQV